MPLFRKTAGDVFNRYYYEMLGLIQKSPFKNQSDKFELLCAMAVVADYSAAAARMNRLEVRNSVSKEMRKVMPDIDFELLSKRMEFYGEIINGEELRGEWYMHVGNINEEEGSAVSRCVALLGDYLYNPLCIDDYDHAPIIIHNDPMAPLTFIKSVMLPMLDKMGAYPQAIYDLR